MGTGGLRVPSLVVHVENSTPRPKNLRKSLFWRHRPPRSGASLSICHHCLCSRESLAGSVWARGHSRALTCMMAVRQARVAEISSLAASRAAVFTLVSLVVWLKYWKSDSGASSLQMLPTIMLMTAKVPADNTGRSGVPSGDCPVLEGSWAGGAVQNESLSPSPAPRREVAQGHWGDIQLCSRNQGSHKPWQSKRPSI